MNNCSFFKIVCCIFLLGFSKNDALAQAPQMEHALLWKIEKKGNNSVSYLLGTNSLINHDFLFQIKGFKKAFKKADVLVSEVLLDQAAVKDAGLNALMKENRIDSLIRGDDYIELAAFFKFKTGLNIQQYNRVKPIALYLYLNAIQSKESDANSGSASGAIPMNSYLQDEARKQNKTFFALESIYTQIDLLYSQFSLQRQAQLVVDYVRNNEKQMQHNNALIKCYKKQDLKCLSDMLLMSEFVESENEFLLADRSKVWLPQLMKIIDGRSTFIAVGALHLSGDKGLIKLLTDQGYKLTPVK